MFDNNMDEDDKTILKKWGLRLQKIRRSLHCPLPVRHIGYVPKNWYGDKRSNPASIDFGLILSCETGKVVRNFNGHIYSFSPPFVSLSIPGAVSQNLSPTVWEELFFSYDASLKPEFSRYGLKLGKRHEIQMTQRLAGYVREVMLLCENIHMPGNADRLDCLCLMIMTECLLDSTSGRSMDPKEVAVRKIASFIEIHYLEKFNLKVIAENHGLAYRTFLRSWKQYLKVTPQEYITGLKIKDACRMLTESPLRIDEIAFNLNFQDPLYFSRLFNRKVGTSPSKYREENQLSQNL